MFIGSSNSGQRSALNVLRYTRSAPAGAMITGLICVFPVRGAPLDHRPSQDQAGQGPADPQRRAAQSHLVTKKGNADDSFFFSFLVGGVDDPCSGSVGRTWLWATWTKSLRWISGMSTDGNSVAIGFYDD